MLNSDFQCLGGVEFPAYRGRQRYMHTFDLAAPTMPAGFEDYLAPVVALCRAAGVNDGVAHLTVDEKIVRAGMSQRRPRPHVDGCFMPEQSRWGHPGPGPAWIHTADVHRMPVIVSASVSGCRAWRGQFDAEPASDGDLSHIAAQLTEAEVLPPNVGYLLSPDCVHESMIFGADTQRSFLRIALPS